MKCLFLTIAICCLAAGSASADLISEFYGNQPGTDLGTQDVELKGTPGATFNLWLVSIETDGISGLVDRATNVTGTYGANGLAVVNIPDLENPSFTLVLAMGFTGATGTTDVDADDDGIAEDLSAFTGIMDAVGVIEDVGDADYASAFGGAYLTPNGSSTDAELVFRDGSCGPWYSTVAGVLVDESGNTVQTNSFSSDPLTATFGDFNPSNVTCTISIDSLTAVCNGNDADVTVMYSTNMTSGTLNLFTNGVAAGTTAASPIVLSIAGPTSMSTVEVVLVDSLDSTCIVTGEVVIPICPEPCMVSVDSVTAACNGDDAEVTVTFSTNLTSGAFNVSTGGVTVATATASPVTFTITGPTVAGMIDVAVTDANDPSCTSTNSVSLPECPVSLIGAVVLKELVYDGGCGPFNEPIGEYFILCNPDTVNAVDITGYEFDDDNDFTDGDGLVFPATTTIPAGECIVVSPTTQAGWEAEYGPLPAGFSFVDGSVGWQALANGGEADLGITMGLNNVGYADIVGEGEFITFDTNTMMWVAGGPASLICCDETISVSATPSACVNNMYDVEITFNAAFPGGTCVFAGVPDTDKEMVLNVNGTDFFFPYTNASPITISNLTADGSAGLPVSLSWEGDAGCATNTTFDAPVSCGATCAIGVGTITAVCNGNDAEITVPFTTNATSGSFNVTTGGVVVASGTTSPIVFTVTGPTTTSTVSVVVTDAADAMCTSTNSVVLPSCPALVPDAVYLKEIVYDVCNPSTLIDGVGPPSGEYVIICNPNATNAADISGYELDDDNDFTDGDGVIFPAGTMILAGECLVVANASQAAWEAEYGTLPAGLSFFDTAGMWETLGNGGGGDSVGISNGQNNTNYADLAADGESLQWDTNTLAWVNGGPASLVCCAADIFITATPTACMNDMYDLEVTFNAPVPGGSCVFTDVPDADKEIVITVAGVTTNVPWDTTNSTFTLTGLPADGTLSNMVTIGWEAEAGCATNATYDAPVPCPPTCTVSIVCPPDVMVGCADDTSTNALGSATATITCETGAVCAATSITFSDVPMAGCTSTIERVWMATFDCTTNTLNCTQLIELLDTDIPLVTLGPDTNLGCNAAMMLPPPMITATDACGVATSGVSAVLTTNGCEVTMTRSAFALDACGNMGVTTQILTWTEDITPPTVTLDIDRTANFCNPTNLPPPMLVATDNCSVVTSGVTAVVITNGCIVMMIRSAFAMDACDNVGVATQTLTWTEDIEPPVITLGADTNLGCNPVVPIPMLSVTDSCSVVTTSGVSAVVTTNGCEVMMVRSAFAMDACGNMGTATQTLTWTEDLLPPVVTLGPDTNLGCNLAALPMPMLTATDNCSVVTSAVMAVVTTNGCDVMMVRTGFALDSCDNMGSATQTILWTLDAAAPVVTLGSSTNLGCNPTNIPMPMLSITGVCSVVTSGVSAVVTTSGCDRVMVRSAFAENSCGVIGVATQTLVWTIDNDIPVVTLGSDTNLGCSAMIPVPTLTVTDSCTIVTSGVMVVVTTNGCDVTMVRTGFAVDSCANMGTATQTIMWTLDAGAPIVTLGPDTNLGCNITSVPMPMLSITDVCSVVTSGLSAVVTTSGCEVVMVRSAFAENSCGNVGVATQTLVWTIDTEAPMVSLGADTNLGCNVMPAPPALVVTDNCSVVTSGVSAVVTTNGCDLTMVRTAFAMDACGNMGVATQTLTWTVDTEPPLVSLGADTNLGCNAVVPMPTLSVTDTCSVVTSGISAVVTTNGCDLTMVRTAFAMDGCGNMGVATQTLTWTVDTEPPLVSLGADTNLGCNAVVPMPTLSVTDTCSVVTSGISAVVTTNGCDITMVRSAFAMDGCGNMGVATQTLTWTVDTEAPIVVLGPSTNLGCTSMLPPPMLNATDTCGVMTSGVSAVVTTNGCVLTMVRTGFAMDACGNMGTATQVLTWVMDNNPPTIVCPTNTLVFTNAPGFDLVITESDLGIIASDDCGTPAILASTSVFDCASAGLYTITATVIDACGQTNSCDVPIEIVCASNAVAPSLAVDIVVDDPGCFCEFGPGSFTVSITNDGPVDLMNVTLSDPLYPTCETNLPFLAVGDSLIYMCEVILTGTVNMVIGSGSANGITATAMKTVNYAFDATPPTLVSCASDITISCGDPIPPADTLGVTGTDDCPTPATVLVTTNPLPSCAGMGVEYVYQLADPCGNLSAPCTQQVIVVDSGGPTFDSTPTDMVLACGNGLPAPEVVGATDACDGTINVGVSSAPLPADCSLRDGIEYVYSATDACGNSISMTQRITFADSEAPAFNRTPTGRMLSCDEGLPPAESLVATDTCAGNTAVDVQTTAIPNACAALNGVQYVYSATDPCGNNVSVTQRFEYAAMDPPVLSMLPASAVLPCGSVAPAAMQLTAASCGGTVLPVSLTTEPIAANCTGTPGTRYTYRATDPCGQSVMHVQEYTFEDTVPPSLTCGGDQTITGISADCMVQVPFVTRSASDSCSTTTIVQSPAPGTAHDATQPLVITITASDSCGNETSCTATYTYECNGRITGVAWQDLALDMDPSNDDLSALGLQGIGVTLTDGAGNIIATDTTDASGGYSFDVPQGDYNVTFNTNDVPSSLPTITTPATGAVTVGSGTTVADINFGAAPLPTAITLESFDATATGEGVRLDWSTSWEEDNLGYRVWRGTAEGPTEQLDGFILAENQAAAYTAADAETASHYWLEVIDTDFNSEFEAVAWTTVPAAPAGPATLLLQAEDGAADFIAGAGTTALVVGFASEPTATDAATGLRLGGQVLRVDGSFGIYLSPAAGTRVLISE